MFLNDLLVSRMGNIKDICTNWTILSRNESNMLVNILLFMMRLFYILLIFFSDISKRNNDYSHTVDFRRGEWGRGVVTFFVLKVPDYESAMFIWVVLQKLSHFKCMKF